ncbi:MAG TPA: IS1595 family transposase [Candidatus Angelobacter sp.]|nr:IS1595 family transposase [Candidatus Angelobacter sp.]
MNLIDVTSQFKTDEECLAYLEKMRWPNRVRCAVCGSDKVSVIERKSETKNKRGKIYQCLEPTCKQQFSVTSGTIFHDSHLPLTKWFMAVAIIVDAKKSVSANQLKRHLGIGSYRTAWYMAHRIRKAMEDTEGSLLTGTVEVDETYIGGKYDPRRKRARREKPGVVGLIERGGQVRTMRISTPSKAVLVSKILDHTTKDAQIYTDESTAYKSVGQIRKHDTVNHITEEWVRGDVHTNTIENHWSLLKRGIIGSFHQVSVKHLDRYLSEFEYRTNNRKNSDLFIKTVARMCGVKPMPYQNLIADPETNQPF